MTPIANPPKVWHSQSSDACYGAGLSPSSRLTKTKVVWQRMRRQAKSILTMVVIVVGLSALTQAGVADAVTNADLAEGKGEVSFAAFDFKAQDLDADPTTDAAKGKYHRKGSPSVTGKVKCLRVSGHNATFSGRIKKSSVPVFKGAAFDVHVADSGLPNGEGDQFTDTLRGGEPSCTTASGVTFPLQKGDIIVIDAP